MGRKLPAETAANYHERTHRFISACEDTASKFPTVVWGNKITTEQLRALQKHNAVEGHTNLDVLDEFFQRTLKGKKVVFIMRDGRSCAVSKVNRTGVDLDQACSRWLYSARVYRYLHEHEGDWHTLKYEDLVDDPERTVQGLCKFLGIEFEPDMLIKGPNSQKMRAEYRQTEIVQKTPIKALPEQYLEQLRSELQYCGYLVS